MAMGRKFPTCPAIFPCSYNNPIRQMLSGHGGEIYAVSRRTGIPLENLLDFSSNVSPLPLPNGLEEFLAKNLNEIRHLPEVDSLELRLALGEKWHMPPDSFMVAGGTTEWIYAVPELFGNSRVLVPSPAYADYRDACIAAESPHELVTTWEPGMPASSTDPARTLARASAPGDVIFYCNPNNPTGTFTNPDALSRVIKSTPATTWIVDESYAPFISEDQTSSLLGTGLPPNCLVLRSFSKIFGIPGLRLGYVAGHPELVMRLLKRARPWQANRLAQLAGMWLMKNDGYQEDVRRFCHREKQVFLDGIKGLSQEMEYMPGMTHFMLFRLAIGLESSWLASMLEKEGIIIRDCSNFQGLEPGRFIRISLREREANRRLLDTLRGIMKAGPSST